uniref:Uncharacterized protein n=1 Tax=Ralstonia solanacearum TaxID=305 RepID=A0A0S4U6H9_RALSL|nr:protein of unknown function [Ralstonia solanacearum]
MAEVVEQQLPNAIGVCRRLAIAM